jgi:hypothetical protein
MASKERILGFRACAVGAGGGAGAHGEASVTSVRAMNALMIAAFLVAPGTIFASSWLSLGKTEDGNSEAFVDRSTITVIGNVRSARFKYVPKHHLDMYRTEWIERSEALSEYDCKNNTTHAVELTLYLEGGATHTNELPMVWGSIMAPWDQAALNFLCAWQGDYPSSGG